MACPSVLKQAPKTLGPFSSFGQSARVTTHSSSKEKTSFIKIRWHQENYYCIFRGISPHSLPEFPTTTKLPRAPYCLPVLSGCHSPLGTFWNHHSGQPKSNLCLGFCFQKEPRLRPWTTLIHLVQVLLSDIKLGSHFCLTPIDSAVFLTVFFTLEGQLL